MLWLLWPIREQHFLFAVCIVMIHQGVSYRSAGRGQSISALHIRANEQ